MQQTKGVLALAIFLLYFCYETRGAAPPPWRRKPPPPRPPPPRPSPRQSPKPPPASRPDPPSPTPPAPEYTYEQNGVRLVGGPGPRGRLEVSTTASWVTGDFTGSSLGWAPVCDDFGFSDADAEVMCNLLGYLYGRKYYLPEVNYRAQGLSKLGRPVGYVSCWANEERRRHLQAGDPAADASASELGGAGTLGPRATHGRALLAPLTGSIATPSEAPYSCMFRSGDCEAAAPVVGLECSNTTMPPAPPPPPSPPSPPPSPPPRSSYIRLVGGSPFVTSDLEPNLCSGSTGKELCFSPSLNFGFGRVELQVSAPGISSAPVWAPLCASPNATIASRLAQLVCDQAHSDVPSVGGTYPTLPQTSLAIPQGDTMGADDFNPSRYQAWVTVVGGTFGSATMVQDLTLQVSASQCDTGYMFAVHCEVAML